MKPERVVIFHGSTNIPSHFRSYSNDEARGWVFDAVDRSTICVFPEQPCDHRDPPSVWESAGEWASFAAWKRGKTRFQFMQSGNIVRDVGSAHEGTAFEDKRVWCHPRDRRTMHPRIVPSAINRAMIAMVQATNIPTSVMIIRTYDDPAPFGWSHFQEMAIAANLPISSAVWNGRVWAHVPAAR